MSTKLVNLRIDFVFKQLFGTKGNEEILTGSLNAILAGSLDTPIISLKLEDPHLHKSYEDDKLSILDLLISPLGKAVLSVLQGDIWTWIREPRIYVKENIAYIHAVKLDGLNLLYTLKKEDNSWKVIKTKKKKLPTVGSEVILEQAFLRAIGIEILQATKTYYGESILFDSKRIIDIVRDEFNDKYKITVQIVTFEGAHNAPCF